MAGKWKVVLSNPQFGPALSNRSNIDLKDKWRNMTRGGTGSSSKHRVTSMLDGVAANPLVNSPEPSSAVLLLEYGDTAKPSSSLIDRKSAP
ncbi:hypothetical protein Tco_0955723 [Tanacetum coccineum]|uniref:HTH myb-type domain-containing protein n=1 Tax=Tanacetum coccineum TaxID=301880 RepID=A0ABQ5E812_9ASTR